MGRANDEYSRKHPSFLAILSELDLRHSLANIVPLRRGHDDLRLANFTVGVLCLFDTETQRSKLPALAYFVQSAVNCVSFATRVERRT